ELRSFPPELMKNVLQDLLGCTGIAHDARRNAVNQRAIAVVELAERSFVARNDTAHQFPVEGLLLGAHWFAYRHPAAPNGYARPRYPDCRISPRDSLESKCLGSPAGYPGATGRSIPLSWNRTRLLWDGNPLNSAPMDAKSFVISGVAHKPGIFTRIHETCPCQLFEPERRF